MLVNATVIVNGKVIEGTYTATQTPMGDSAELSAHFAPDEVIGYVVRRAVDEARKQGYHMADPNAFVRVEFK